MIKCIMCNCKILDGGLIFCPKCRVKDIFLKISCYYHSDRWLQHPRGGPRVKKYQSIRLKEIYGDG